PELKESKPTSSASGVISPAKVETKEFKPSPTSPSPTEPGMNEKVLKLDGRLEEITKRADATTEIAKLSLDNARFQMTLFTTLASLLTAILVGAIAYLFLEYKKLKEEVSSGVRILKKISD